jgi:uncharacterized protein (DUF1697 family)
VALVVFLRGVNVGGHRTFRPAALARELAHLDAVNIGAAGTFVVRRPVARARLREELASRLPFEVEIAICEGRDILELTSRDFFAGYPVRRDVVRFVSVFCRSPRNPPPVPLDLPPTGEWLVRIVARDRRFVIGVYRRKMSVLAQLGKLDRLFGVPLTTRNWNTVTAIAKVLEDGAR